MEQIMRLSRNMEKMSNNDFKEWINDYGKNFLSKLILNGLFYELEHSKNLNEWDQKYAPKINKINKNAQNIHENKLNDTSKQEHKSNENAEDHIKPIILDDLPQVMISHICSFLQISELLKFERCNKFVFIGSRTPITLYKMDANNAKKCIRFGSSHCYEFYRFKNLKHIHFSDDSIFNISWDKEDWCDRITKTFPFKHVTPKWNNVESLTFTGYWSDWLSIEKVAMIIGTECMPRLKEFNWLEKRENIFTMEEGWEFEVFFETMNTINKISKLNCFNLSNNSLNGIMVNLNDFINVNPEIVTPIEIINLINNNNLSKFQDVAAICLDFYEDDWDGSWNDIDDENENENKCVRFLRSMSSLNYIKIKMDIENECMESSIWPIYEFWCLFPKNLKRLTLNINDKFVIRL